MHPQGNKGEESAESELNLGEGERLKGGVLRALIRIKRPSATKKGDGW